MVPVRVLIAPDSFTGLWTAARAASLLGEGVASEAAVRGVDVRVTLVPMADGGTGTLDVLASRVPGRLEALTVKDALGEPRPATYLRLQDGVVVVEVAQASGIEPLLRPMDRRHPFLTSTFGAGELLLHAYGAGCRRFVVTLGGSGTNDGGAGLCQALGMTLRGERGLPYLDRWAEGFGAAALLEASGADFSRMLPFDDVELTVATDVESPLLGPQGASAVFGPQKGATAEMIPVLEQALARWADWAEEWATGRGPGERATRFRDLPGAGAAGGLGFALACLFGGRLVCGASWVAGAVGLDAAIADADLVLTGEGRLDGQSFLGKVVAEVAARSRSAGRCVVAVSGSVRAEQVPPGKLDHVVDASAGGAVDMETLEREGADRMRRAAGEALAWYLTAGRAMSS